MPVSNIKLLRKEGVAEETMAFHFEKPAGFEYRAGQFGDFTLINPRRRTPRATRAASRWRARRTIAT